MGQKLGYAFVGFKKRTEGLEGNDRHRQKTVRKYRFKTGHFSGIEG